VFAQRTLFSMRFPEFNTENTEKSHRGHGEFIGEQDMDESGRRISPWFSVTLCVLCVEFFGI
jgi:hypothetical protein